MKIHSFFEEARKYLERLSSIRSEDDLKLIEKFAEHIDCGEASIFVAIPCHVRETGLYECFAAYANSIGCHDSTRIISAGLLRDGESPDELRLDGVRQPEVNSSGLSQVGVSSAANTVIIVFLNGGVTMSAEEFSTSCKLREQEILLAEKAFPNLKIMSVSHHFQETVLLSRIRGIITDAIIRACFGKSIKDPIIVSNDADALYYSPNYLSNIYSCFEELPQVDYVSGPIYWSGCDEPGRVHYLPNELLPEVYFSDILGQETDHIYREHGVVYCTGCNSAFRLAALCAINGYDYDFAPYYDVEIGIALNRYRATPDASCPDAEIDLNDFARFLSHCELSTNPRRAIYAHLSNISFGHQFDNFESILGADLELAEYIKAYMGSNVFIQCSDLSNYFDDNSARSKVQMRLTATFVDFINGEPGNRKQLLSELICQRLGLTIESINSSDQQLNNITFDWKDSKLVTRFVKRR